MTYSWVLSAIESATVSIHTISDSNAEIHGVRFLTESSSMGDSATLYICFPSQIPVNVPINNGVYSFLVLGTPCKISTAMCEHRINLAFVEQFEDPNDIVNLVLDELGQELSISHTMRYLNNALFSNKGLQNLINAAYEVFKNPIIVIDPSDKHIAKAFGNEPVEPGSIFANFLRDESKYGYVEEVGREFQDRIGLSETLGKTDSPYRFFHEIFQKETMIGLIRVKGIAVGRITLIAQYHDFGEFDEQFFSRLLYLVGQELQKKALFTENRNEMKAYFLNDLLSTQDVPEAMINRRLQELAITIKDNLYVAVVRASDDTVQGNAILYGMIAERLHPVLSGSIYLIRSSELVILFNLPRDKYMNGYINKTLKQQALSNKLNIGVSNMFHDLTHIKKHYEQALRAIQIGASYRQFDVTYFNLAAPVELLNVVRRNDDLISFCSPNLLELLRVDRENNSELMLTLYFFLETFGNTTKSAELLHVHKNTLLYRLSKIKKILQSDLTNGEEIYQFMMSMRILRISRIFIPPGNGPVFNIDDVE